jgi:hypothetical protein
MAYLVALLASEGASFITGQAYKVNGGLLCHELFGWGRKNGKRFNVLDTWGINGR